MELTEVFDVCRSIYFVRFSNYIVLHVFIITFAIKVCK